MCGKDFVAKKLWELETSARILRTRTQLFVDTTPHLSCLYLFKMIKPPIQYIILYFVVESFLSQLRVRLNCINYKYIIIVTCYYRNNYTIATSNDYYNIAYVHIIKEHKTYVIYLCFIGKWPTCKQYVNTYVHGDFIRKFTTLESSNVRNNSHKLSIVSSR